MVDCSVVGGMIAIGYHSNKRTSPPSEPVVETDDVVTAWNSTTANQLDASSAKNSLSKSRIANAEVVEPSPVSNDPPSGEEGLSPRSTTLDKSLLVVADPENEKAATRDKDEVKKTANNSAKKTQRRASLSDRDRKFSPLREI